MRPSTSRIPVIVSLLFVILFSLAISGCTSPELQKQRDMDTDSRFHVTRLLDGPLKTWDAIALQAESDQSLAMKEFLEQLDDYHGTLGDMVSYRIVEGSSNMGSDENSGIVKNYIVGHYLVDAVYKKGSAKLTLIVAVLDTDYPSSWKLDAAFVESDLIPAK